jgi:hypothetical protein
MKKKAKENFESNLDNILLDNSTNPNTYWKIMKMLIKSNKGSNCIPPLRNTINDEHLENNTTNPLQASFHDEALNNSFDNILQKSANFTKTYQQSHLVW